MARPRRFPRCLPLWPVQGGFPGALFMYYHVALLDVTEFYGKKLWHVCGLFIQCLHLHLHLRIVSAVAIVFAFAFALGVYRFACVCRFPLRLHLCCVCVYTCIALAFALVLPCCLLCNGVALGLHLCSVCFVPSEFRKETLKNPHLLWHLLAVVCVGRCWFRLRLWFPPAVASLGTASSRVALL